MAGKANVQNSSSRTPVQFVCREQALTPLPLLVLSNLALTNLYARLLPPGNYVRKFRRLFTEAEVQ